MLHCDLDCRTPFFFQKTPAHDDVWSDQVWLPKTHQFRRYSRKSESYFDSMSPRRDPDLEDSKQLFSTWHSGSWCYITIPSLVTKCSVVLKISSKQIFTDSSNLCCDLHLQCSNPIFPQGTPAYDAVLSNQVWLQMDQQFRRYNENESIFII